jgi:transposase
MPAGRDGRGHRAARRIGRATAIAFAREGADVTRRLCRERKTLTVERVQHVNRIKELLFSQGVSGCEPLRRNRRQRLDELKTSDGRPLPPHLKS